MTMVRGQCGDNSQLAWCGENRSLLLDAASHADLERIVGERIDYYNRRRRHSALGNRVPLVYLESLKARG